MELTLLHFCLLFALTPKLVMASVRSCFACAGPFTDCVNNNRTDWLKMDCRDFLVEGESLAARTSEPALLEKFDSQVGPRSDTKINCFTLTYKRAGDRRAVKGCAPVKVLDRDICNYMEELVAVVGGGGPECHVCDEDDCNSASSFSPLLVLLVVVSGCFCTVLQ